jgi:hypothetical protein
MLLQLQKLGYGVSLFIKDLANIHSALFPAALEKSVIAQHGHTSSTPLLAGLTAFNPGLSPSPA